MSGKRVGFDLDCTVADTHGLWIEHFNDRASLHGHPRITRADGHYGGTMRDLCPECYEACCASRDIVRGATPYPGAVETIRGFMRAGVTVAFISARRQSLLQSTEDWLRRHGLPAEHVHLTSRKALAAAQLGLDAFVDDCVENFGAMSLHTHQIVYTQPWNAGAPLRSWQMRAGSWPELSFTLTALLGLENIT